MIKNKIFLSTLAFIFLFSTTVVGAEEDAQAVAAEELKAAGGGEASAAGEETSPGNVTMDFKNADISNVLRILSYKSGVNIVAGPEVKGMVTIRLTDVPWEKALDVVLRTYGFAYERVGNIIRVTTIESLKQEELTTEVYSLSYGKAEDVNEAIENMLTERGKTKFDERTNTLVVTDIPTNLYKISQVIEKLDRRTPQVMIEAKIIETSLDDDENLGIDWSTKITVRGAERPTTLPFGRFSDMQIEERFARFIPIGQTAANSTSATVGVSSGSTTQADFPSTGGPEMLGSFPFVETDQFSFGTLDFTTFQAVLEYLDSRTGTEILSNPRITTLNNQQSNILVGQNIGIPTYERNSETGQMEITGYEERSVGVILTVTPHINVEGDISVDLKPEISDLLRYDTLDASRGIVAPVFSTREATSQVMLRDGETIMLGGLIKKTVSDKVNKIPFLGDIPLIGKTFFTKTEKAVDRTELIIFLTVHLLKEEWVAPAGSAAAYVPMPLVKDEEIAEFVPVAPPAAEEKKKAWWQWW